VKIIFLWIIEIDGSKDIFVYHHAIQGEGFKSLKEGNKVESEVSEDPKGLQANKVRTTGQRNDLSFILGWGLPFLFKDDCLIIG
jgi:CspA family cold shock protein